MDTLVSGLPADRKVDLEAARELNKRAAVDERLDSLRGRKAVMEAGPGKKCMDPGRFQSDRGCLKRLHKIMIDNSCVWHARNIRHGLS